MANTELYHYGILGQRWGIRRFQRKDGSLTPAGKKRQSEGTDSKDATDNKNSQSKGNDSKKQSESKPKTLNDMTDAELNARINRLQLEKRYAELLKGEQKEKLFDGKKFVVRVLEKSGENILTQTTTYVMGTVVNKSLEKWSGDKNAINPKKGQKDK